MENNAFILYTSYFDILSDLTNEQMGELFRAILEYKTTKKQPVVSVDLKVVFKFIKNQLDLDEKKYMEKTQKQSNNGKKGGAPKGNQNAKKQPKTTQNNPNKHNDNVNDNDNDNVNDNVIDIKEVVFENEKTLSLKSEQNQKFLPPTKKEVEDYLATLGRKTDVDTFLEYYEASDWCDKSGLKLNWKQKAISWCNQDERYQRRQETKLKAKYEYDQDTIQDAIEKWAQKGT